VQDIVEGIARSMGEKLGVKYYVDYGRLLRDSEVDAVIIATPTFLHRDMVIEAAEAGKHVFVEKPLAVRVKESLDILSYVRKRGVKLQVGYMRRFDAAYRRARQVIEEGGIGKPTMFVSIARDPAPPPGWGSDPSKSGGIFLDMLSHDFDLARWLVGSEISEVYVVGGNYIYEELRKTGDLDVVSILFKFMNGAQGFIHGARRCAFGYDLRTEVYGSEGVVYIGSYEDNMFAHGDSRGITKKGVAWFERRFYEAYVEELKSFVKAVLDDKEPEVTVLDGLRAVEIAEACWRSFRERKPVKVEMH